MVAKNDAKNAPAAKLSERKEAIAKTGELSKDAKTEKPAKAPKAEKPAKALAPERVATEGGGKNIIDRSKHVYPVNKEQKTAGGRASVDNDDPLAAALRGKSAGDVIDLVRDNGGEVNPNWENLNQGLARMAAGNVLRKLAKRSEGVKIDGDVIKLDGPPTKPEKVAKAA